MNFGGRIISKIVAKVLYFHFNIYNFFLIAHQP